MAKDHRLMKRPLFPSQYSKKQHQPTIQRLFGLAVSIQRSYEYEWVENPLEGLKSQPAELSAELVLDPE